MGKNKPGKREREAAAAAAAGTGDAPKPEPEPKKAKVEAPAEAPPQASSFGGRGGGRGFGGGRGGRGGGRGAGFSGRGAGGGGGGTADHAHEIFVKYLPHTTTESELRSFFARCGPINGEARLLRNPSTGQCKGCGWVSFQSESAFQAAMAMDGHSYFDSGRHVEVTAASKGRGGVHPTQQASGTHTPAMLEEFLRDVVTNTAGTYVDGTFGRGGHTRAMLQKLGAGGKVHAFDMDPEAITVGKKLMEEDERFVIHHRPFSDMAEVLKKLGVKPDGVFLDLGISSPQFDDAHRGFRPEQDGPLDLRFDQSKGVPAWEFLESVDRQELISILCELGDVTDHTAARRIADAVVLARESPEGIPRTTREFAQLVADAKGLEYQAMHPAKLTFQGIRIYLNEEFDEMKKGMKAALKCLKAGGVLGVITWKHTECAILVDFFRRHEVVREEFPLWKWLQDNQKGVAEGLERRWGMQMGDPLRPTQKELSINSRSRSALLHILHKKKEVLIRDVEKAAYPLRGFT